MGIQSIQQGSIHRVKQWEMADSKHVLSGLQHFEIVGNTKQGHYDGCSGIFLQPIGSVKCW